MKLKKTIPADQLIGLSPDLEGMVQSIRGQQTVGKDKKIEKNEEEKKEVGEGDTEIEEEEEEITPKKKDKKTSTSKTSRKKTSAKKAAAEEDIEEEEDFDDNEDEEDLEEEEEKTTKRFKKSTKLSKRQVDIDENDNEMDMFNKYVDYYAGQPGRGRAVWLEDELVESFSKLKDYDPKYSIRTVICAALRTFIAKNAKELGELKRPVKKGLF